MNSFIMESTEKKSRIPARLDFAQSGTGLILGLFMWVHMLLVGSIILGKGSFNFVAKFMELSFLSDNGQGYPIAVFFAVCIIFTLFITHALLGVRKFPISWKQHRIIVDQMQMMKHQDTNLWYVQVVTGFIMFFAGSVHLSIMLTNPGSIDPYLSADRIVSGNMWPLYLILLICVELHGTIGIYRLCMKWGWFTKNSRTALKTAKNRLTIFFLSLGILALLVFIVIGIKHKDQVGERYDNHVTAVESEPAGDEVKDSKVSEEEISSDKITIEEEIEQPEKSHSDSLDSSLDKIVPLEPEDQHQEDGHQEAQHEDDKHQNDEHEVEKTQPADLTHQ